MDKKNMNIEIERIDYQKLYEKLYRLGYHSKAKNHGQRYAKYVCDNFHFNNILEIGCSNGLATKSFQHNKRLAYGMDISEIAIRYAGEKFFVPNCIVGNILDIPFKDKFFDAVFTCDVLEHLTLRDVDRALKEIRRVSKQYLFAVIDEKEERNRHWINKGKALHPGTFGKIKNLHLTVMSFEEWIIKIEKYGLKFIRNDDNLYMFKLI